MFVGVYFFWSCSNQNLVIFIRSCDPASCLQVKNKYCNVNFRPLFFSVSTLSVFKRSRGKRDMAIKDKSTAHLRLFLFTNLFIANCISTSDLTVTLTPSHPYNDADNFQTTLKTLTRLDSWLSYPLPKLEGSSHFQVFNFLEN